MAASSSGGRRMKIGLSLSLSERSLNGQTPTYRDVQAMAQEAEHIGCDSVWLADHLLSRFPGQDESGQWEVFSFLAALAANTSRIALGPLVACTSFRNPALLAKIADSLDEISQGRFILGLGAGWHEPEYKAFGYPFDHRASRFEEALQIIVPLLREGHVDFTGTYYQAENCVLRPRGPSGGRLPIWIGARRPRMLDLVARYADAHNAVWHVDTATLVAEFDDLHAACARVGRDPARRGAQARRPEHPGHAGGGGCRTAPLCRGRRPAPRRDPPAKGRRGHPALCPRAGAARRRLTAVPIHPCRPGAGADAVVHCHTIWMPACGETATRRWPCARRR